MKITKKQFINKILYSLIISIALIFIFSCPYNTTTETKTTYIYSSTVPQLSVNQFWAIDVDSNSMYVVNATPLYTTGTHCKIYIDKNYSSYVSSTQAQAIAAEFESNLIGSYSGIYGLDRNFFGEESDFNGDGTVTILLLNLGSSIGGYFDPYDLYAYDGTFYTNQQDMIYINCVYLTVGSGNFYATIAHEFQHLINYNQKVFVQKTTGSQTWLTEGLSTVAEYEYLYNKYGTWSNNKLTNSDGYLYYFNNYISYYNFLSWESDFSNYSAASIFFQWLRIQSAGSDSVYKAIIDNAYINTDAVLQAVNKNGYLINSTTWSNWGDLLRSWFIANAYLDTSSIYGYGSSDYLYNKVSINKLSGGSSYSLLPGEGIYVNKTTLNSDQSGDIYYAGLTPSTKTTNTTKPYTGTYILCYNTNTTPNGTASTTATFTSISASQINTSTVQTQNTSSINHMIDLNIDFNGKDTILHKGKNKIILKHKKQ